MLFLQRHKHALLRSQREHKKLGKETGLLAQMLCDQMQEKGKPLLACFKGKF